MDVRRTAAVKLTVSDEQRDALHRTAEQYLYCAIRIAEFCWSGTSFMEYKTNKRQVQDALYADFREETDLQAQLVQAAIRRGVEAAGGEVLVVSTDVADEDQVEAAADAVEDEFGPIDV